MTEQALDMVHDRFTAVMAAHGPQALRPHPQRRNLGRRVRLNGLADAVADVRPVGQLDDHAVRHDEQAFRIAHNLQRVDQIFEIQKRLARAHPHQIRAVRRFRADAVNVVEDDNYLLDNFSGS